MRYCCTCHDCNLLFEKYCKDNPPQADCIQCGVPVTELLPMGVGRVKPNLTVIQDIEPYRSPIDRSVISSRSSHRDHMREHGVVEMGNEYPKAREVDRAPTERAGYDIVRSLEASR